ncbi:extensin family protein [Agrobacterium tumefaciens]|uniref:extensin-like domain-containing protein n=1 Tax=Agrobacterium tumefaciens complex TaxID=1183400 RepID=UPI00158556B4|nr:extensin family protein [Agrobacterium tumefaciens]NUL15492.1 extensin family protein [Agrobacterium tumefaciens]UXS09831.1 extensin family protein [Agrobacterium tumefaciens]UXS17190.1 extensin family protein [Agrobacterium tumefaciens]UXT65806.1 extensin family protein [Agrobacterium tumefaciens]
MLHRLCLLVATLALISASEPPAQVPVPQPKPGDGQSSTPSEKPSDETPQSPAEAPKPAPKPQRPEEQKPDAKPQASEEQKSDDEKTPADKGSDDARKEGEGKDDGERKKPGDEAAKPDEKPPEPVKPEDPAALQTCLGALKEIGAEFKQLEPIRDAEQGCGIEAPVELSVVLPGIKLEPSGTMRCETALALSRWTKEMMLPAAALALPEKKVTAIANASTYICRNRNSAENGKISEHAKGNAVDISTISFDKGEPLVMKPRVEDGTPEGAFQRTITAAACLFFRTVLSPGSDATHQDHLHLDVLERKGSYLYCR